MGLLPFSREENNVGNLNPQLERKYTVIIFPAGGSDGCASTFDCHRYTASDVAGHFIGHFFFRYEVPKARNLHCCSDEPFCSLTD
jgi:hypothetical protein